MATKRTSEEKDYQDLLKVTQSMLGDMGKAMSDLGDSSDGRNRKLKQEADITKQILGSVTDVADTNKLINAISRQQTNINKQNYGVNEQLKNSQLAQLDAVKAILQTGQQTAKVFKGVDDVLSETASSFTSGIDGIMGKLKGIPIVGKALGNLFQPVADNAKNVINKTVSKFGSGFKKSFMQSRVAGGSFTSSLTSGLKGGMQGMSGMVRVAGRLLAALGPVGIAIAVIATMALLGMKRFQELDSAAKAFREETGLLNSQTRGLVSNIQSVSTEFAGLGVSAADVAKAAGAFTTEFSGLEQPSKAVLGSMVTLNKNFGIGVKEGAQLNKVFQNIGGLTAEQSQHLIGQTVQMSKMAGVAPSEVIKDMAESSEYAYRYFNGSPKALASAAVQAAKLGTSIKEAGAVADGLLDFETSITSELEASAILGTNLNLSQARYLAANGKAVEAQQEVLNQVSSLGDLTKLNKFEQEALTKATGMQFGDLVNQQRIRKQFSNLDKNQLASAMSLMSAGKDISKMTKSDLDAQTKKLAAQQEMQSQMDKLSNTVSGLGTAFMDMFAPAAAFIITILVDTFDVLSSLLMPALKAMGSIFKVIFGVLGAIWNIFMAILKPIFAIAGAILENISEPLGRVSDALQPLFAKFGELKDKIMEAVTPILPVFKFLGVLLGTIIGGAIDVLVSAFSVGFDAIFSIIEGVSGFFQTYLVAPLQWVIDNVSKVFSSIGSFLGLGGDSEPTEPTAGSSMGTTATASINDGVVQNGKVVNTNPADTLLATKDPASLLETIATGLGTGIGGLLGGLMGGGGQDNTAIVAKLDELIMAVQSNRDVYMDKEKVSSAVVKTNEKSGENRFGLMGA